MIDEITRAAFADELQKIAGVKSQVGEALNAGWHGLNHEGRPMTGANWAMGKGRLTSKLPFGGKAMTLLSTAMQAPSALGRQDPTGKGHSRLERTTGLVGNTIGGLAATGALMRSKAMGGLLGRHPLITGLVGGIGGGILGERAITTPWAAKRRMFRRYPKAPPPTTDEGWRNTAPGGLNTTPDAVVGQAQAM